MKAPALPPQRLAAHEGQVGGLPIRRALPQRERRLIGAWCFLDHAGPADLAAPMRVAPHPHTGLQTFSWLIEGEILHRDSLGSEQLLRPGQVNLMTAGRGIAHSEESLSPRLQLAQLWIALPEAQRFCAPRFEHHPQLPQLPLGGFVATLLVGALQAEVSPVAVHTPLLGVDLACPAAGGSSGALALAPDFEHGLMVLEGQVLLSLPDGSELAASPGELIYLPPGVAWLQLRSAGAARALLLGGAPFEEPVLLWWNFVGRTAAEIERFAADWNGAASAFGAVSGYAGERLLAPPVPGLRPPPPAHERV